MSGSTLEAPNQSSTQDSFLDGKVWLQVLSKQSATRDPAFQVGKAQHSTSLVLWKPDPCLGCHTTTFSMQDTPECRKAPEDRASHRGNQQQCAADYLALQRELEVATDQLEKWKSDHSWTLEQLVKSQEKERARKEGQLR
jgi:hypothetical protein